VFQRPTKEVPSPATLSQVLATVLGTLILFMLANRATGQFFRLYTTNIDIWVIREKWHLVQSMDAPVDTLVVGDSSALMGVVSGEMGHEMGGTVMNLATIGAMGALDDAWMLQVYLERFGAPQRVVIVHNYEVWEFEPLEEAIFYIPISQVRGKSLQPEMEMSLSGRFEWGLARNVPLYYEAAAFREKLTALAFGEEEDAGRFELPYELEAGGYAKVDKANPGEVRRGVGRQLKAIEGKTFTISEINAAALESMIALGEQYQFEIYIADGPVAADLHNTETFQEFALSMEAYFTQVGQKHDHVNYLGTIATFPNEQMRDYVHTIHPASVIYTQTLVSRIQEME
jgi:hypothetical protein